METTAERTRNNNFSIMHYWGLVKNLDDKLKLELVSMLISSMRLSSVDGEEDRERDEKVLVPFRPGLRPVDPFRVGGDGFLVVFPVVDALVVDDALFVDQDRFDFFGGQ